MAAVDSAWGNQIVGPMPAAADTVEGVLLNNDLGPQPTAHGVCLYRELVGDTPPSALSDLVNAAYYADITIGAGAASTRFLCDWKGQFSVVCSRIEIRARSYAPRSGTYRRAVDLDDQPIQREIHGAFVGFGGWHSGKAPTFTGREVSIAASAVGAGVGYRIPVPKFGRRFFPRLSRYTSGGSSTPIQPDLEELFLSMDRPGGAGNGASGLLEFLSVDVIRNGIDIGDAVSVSIVAGNGSMPSGAYALTPMFELAL
jgi:hypothetical protein